MPKKSLILIVDDEEDIRESVKNLLEDNNFEVETAENGEACLKKLKIIKPNLILLDILMPGMTTKEIISKVNKLYPKLPIIFLTVVRLAEATKQQLIQGKIIDYIEKPFDNKDLLTRIKRILMI
ncbi:MAG: response regulator [Candidatus Nanoarchaeia archaeon]|nr:response regulator [Candidatus Nanoarchaeia archaeon]MDD5588096.1 response regulator [Candidatus Nanoarchaeia archaeon]